MLWQRDHEYTQHNKRVVWPWLLRFFRRRGRRGSAGVEPPKFLLSFPTNRIDNVRRAVHSRLAASIRSFLAASLNQSVVGRRRSKTARNSPVTAAGHGRNKALFFSCQRRIFTQRRAISHNTTAELMPLVRLLAYFFTVLLACADVDRLLIYANPVLFLWMQVTAADLIMDRNTVIIWCSLSPDFGQSVTLITICSSLLFISFS